jgi:hypothetical protein
VKQPTYQQLKAIAQRKGYKWFSKPYDLNVWGVRAGIFAINKIDDLICVAYVDVFGNEKVFCFTVTTDPGAYYMNNPLNTKGCAVLQPGQYLGSHKIGKHRGKYKALVQVRSMKFWRVKMHKGTPDWANATTETSIIGANIHKMLEAGIATLVGKWSAGCQVFASPWENAAFLNLVDQQLTMLGTDVVSYTLIVESDLA